MVFRFSLVPFEYILAEIHRSFGERLKYHSVFVSSMSEEVVSENLSLLKRETEPKFVKINITIC